MLTLKRKVWPDKSDSDYFMAYESYFQSFESFLVFPSGSRCAWFSWLIIAQYEYEWILNMELVITNVYIRTEKLRKMSSLFFYKPLQTFKKAQSGQDLIVYPIFSIFSFVQNMSTQTH